MPDNHLDACHAAGNKSAGSGPARSNVTILVNCSVSLHSPASCHIAATKTPAFMQ